VDGANPAMTEEGMALANEAQTVMSHRSRRGLPGAPQDEVADILRSGSETSLSLAAAGGRGRRATAALGCARPRCRRPRARHSETLG